jgi:hypothetical protein
MHASNRLSYDEDLPTLRIRQSVRYRECREDRGSHAVVGCEAYDDQAVDLCLCFEAGESTFAAVENKRGEETRL